MGTISEQTSGVLGFNTDLNKKENPYISGSDLYKMDGWYLGESSSITKRRGFQKLNTSQLLDDGTSSAFTGLAEFISSGGSIIKVATTTVGLYKFGTPTASEWNAVSLANAGGARTGDSTNLYDMAMLFDQLYIGGGASTDSNLRFDGTNAYQMGITSPGANTATVGLYGTGITAATGYYYNYTYYNSATGQESNPATADSASTGPFTNQSVAVQFTYSADPQVDKVFIYRTTDGGGVLLYVGQKDNVVGTGTGAFADNYADSTLGVAIEGFANGVPPHFDKIEVYKGITFMAGDPANKSRVWFSASGKPGSVDSNDFRDLDANDGDTITGLKRFQTTVVAFKNNSIWNASGDDRDTFEFERKATTVGAVNNACIVEVPVLNMLAFMTPDAKIYLYNGVDAAQTATGIEPILSSLNTSKLGNVVGCCVPWLNQIRWIVPDGVSNYGDLIIWYDYLLGKWGTIEIDNTPGNFCATLHDSASKLQFYLGGIVDSGAGIDGGYVWQGDLGGTDDGSDITCEVVDRGHPLNDTNPEDQKSFSHVFVWFKPNAEITLSVYGYLDDPDGTPVLLGTISCANASGQGHLHMNKVCRRLYIRIVESSNLQGLVLRGWKVFYKNLGRHNAP